MPSSSPRCAQFPRAQDKVHFYIKLKELRDQMKGLARSREVQETNYSFDLLLAKGKQFNYCLFDFPEIWIEHNLIIFKHNHVLDDDLDSLMLHLFCRGCEENGNQRRACWSRIWKLYWTKGCDTKHQHLQLKDTEERWKKQNKNRPVCGSTQVI